jgi:hypothetical protein
MADDWGNYFGGLRANSLGVQKGSRGNWEKIHGDIKSRAGGRFRAWSLIESTQGSILVKGCRRNESRFALPSKDLATKPILHRGKIVVI